MIRYSLLGAGLALLASCATETAPAPVTDPVTAPAPMSEVDRGLETARDLAAAGNEQTAIDRLTQLLGDPELSARETADILYARAQLRHGAGNDLFGAISDLDEMLAIDPSHPDAETAIGLRDMARGEATSLNGRLEQGGLSSSERFEILFRLGQHQDALDVMVAEGLTPDNGTLIDFYQMGYLCEGTEFTGPSYDAVEPDGTQRTLQVCDFGK